MAEPRATILNVNDREANRYALSRVLKSAGYQVLEAENGAQALELARAQPHLMVLDVNLPDMSGFEVARRLKEDPATSSILVLHVSAISVFAHHRAEGLARGADGYLTEPIEPEELIATINALLRLGAAESRARKATRELQVHFDALKRAEGAIRLLSDASRILMSSQHADEDLDPVAALAVPALGDFCVIDLRGPEDAVLRVAVAGAPGSSEQVAALRQQVPTLEDPEGAVQRALIEGHVTFERQLAPEAAGRLWAMPKEAPGRSASPTSLLCVPLAIRDRTLGAITFLSTDRERAHTEDDLTLAKELAGRVALAVENARLYREAQTAIQTRDEFFSIASHELKNPLSALLLQLKLLQRELRRTNLKPETAVAKVDAAERNATRIGELVQELLDTTRIRAGRLDLRVEPVDLAILVRDIVHRLESELQAAQCTCTVETHGAVVGEWDRSRVEQVVYNLVTNGIKYGAGKPLAVEVVRAGPEARFTVRDQGIGISPEDQARIFEPFERGRSTGASGLGLGLYIARKIVEAHGGRFELKSEPGKGSAFTFFLPVDDAAAP